MQKSMKKTTYLLMDVWSILGFKNTPRSLQKPSKNNTKKESENVTKKARKINPLRRNPAKTCADIEREARCCIRYCMHVDLLCLYFGLRQCPREQERVRREPQ